MTVDVLTEIVIDRPHEEVAAFAADPTNAPHSDDAAEPWGAEWFLDDRRAGDGGGHASSQPEGPGLPEGPPRAAQRWRRAGNRLTRLTP